MKRNLLTGLLLLVISGAFGQATYYWVGGTNGDWTVPASWNTQQDGSGTNRTTPNAADVLIFSGTGNVVPVFPGSATLSQLKLTNGSFVTFRRNGGSTGTSTLTISGDGVAETDDLFVDATSSLTLNSITASYSFILQLGTTGAPATGAIHGTATVSGSISSRIEVENAGTLAFANGSTFYSNLTAASSYPFGNNTHGADKATLFKAGSTLVFQGGNSVFATNTTFNPIVFETGSTMVFEAAEVSSIFSNRTFANITVRPLASAPSTPVTVTVNGNVYNVDTLTIQPLATFNLQASGVFPLAGSIINNGTFGVAASATSSNLLMYGNGVTQTIGGSGTFNPLWAFSVGTQAQVLLNRSLVINGSTSSSMTGSLNLQNFILSGTGNFQSRAPQTASGTPATLTLNAYTVAIDPTYFASGINTANVGVGLLVSGSGIQPNTYIIGTNSASSQMTISKPATTGGATSLTITGNAPTLATSNAGGIDAAITITTKSFGANSNYTFNTATTAPFSTSSTNAAGNITFNAPVTLNRNVAANGIVTLTNGNITIPILDTLRLTATASLVGADATKYFVTGLNTTTGEQGALRIDNITTATVFPIGSASNYLPATITPVTASDFAAGVFEGITTNGAANGTPFTATEKQNVVDAVWNVTRINGTGDATLTTSWPQSLEGSNFTTLPSIGIMHNDGTTWGPKTGSGDNTANTATASFNSFSPFAVTANAGALPMNWKHVSASVINGKVKIDWITVSETAMAKYEVERSFNGRSFENIGSVAAKNNVENVYSFNDAMPSTLNYYRIKSIGLSGEIKYSTIMKLNMGKGSIQVYPNPATDVVSITGLPSRSSIRIANMAGATVYQLQPEQNTALITIPIASLSKGSYIIQVIDGDKIETKMFQKQ